MDVISVKYLLLFCRYFEAQPVKAIKGKLFYGVPGTIFRSTGHRGTVRVIGMNIAGSIG